MPETGDPRNTLDRYKVDEYYFTPEKDESVQDTKSGLPKYVVDWIDHYIATN